MNKTAYIHPFPARMAPEVVFRTLPSEGPSLDVLDPMMGSGTTLVSARLKGHRATGVDRDPLSVLIASAATRDIHGSRVVSDSEALLNRAICIERRLSDRDAYPIGADEATRAFVRYWFDRRSRRQLASLIIALSERRFSTATLLKCALSRMIITKQGGVTLAEDISHSRPHRTRDVAPNAPFDLFARSIKTILRNAAFRVGCGLPGARTLKGDCRHLPFKRATFDYVITSPPYLNAIDYLRGHKFSLIWFGCSILDLSDLRGTNVGSSRGIKDDAWDDIISAMIPVGATIEGRLLNTLRLYVCDLYESISEIHRVLRPGGSAVFVIGDCNVRGILVKNSTAIINIAKQLGFHRAARKVTRPLPADRRYLPPPRRSRTVAQSMLENRMWNEVVLHFAR